MSQVGQGLAAGQPIPAPEVTGGFFYCEHCDHLVSLPTDSDTDHLLKCPRCRKRAVVWRVASPPRDQRPATKFLPPESVIAAAWFRAMREEVG